MQGQPCTLRAHLDRSFRLLPSRIPLVREFTWIEILLLTCLMTLIFFTSIITPMLLCSEEAVSGRYGGMSYVFPLACIYCYFSVLRLDL